MLTILESLETIAPLLVGETVAWAFWLGYLLSHDVRMGKASLGVSEFKVLMLRLL